MKLNIFKLIILIIIFASKLSSTSFVYNMRIAETTRRQSLPILDKHPHIIAMTLVDQFRNQVNGTNEMVFGGLGTYIYSPRSYYARIDVAAAHTHHKFKTVHASQNQTDDILFSAGYTLEINKVAKVTFSGFFGVPTHGDKSFDPGLQFGTGHVGFGGQIDGIAAYTKSKNHKVIVATRLIHFLSATLPFTINNKREWFVYKIGDLFDFIIANNSSWGQHNIEIGYDLTMDLSASIHPNLDDVVKQTNFVQSSFYGFYKYGFLISKLPSAVIFGISLGVGHIGGQYRYKNLLSMWAIWGLKF